MKMVHIEPVPDRPKDISEDDWKKIKRAGKIEVPYVTAIENIKNSKGAYRIAAEAQNVAQMVTPSLEEMDGKDLKRLYLQTLAMTGKRPGKKVSRAEMIKLIQSVEDSIEIVDDEDEEPEGPEEPPAAEVPPATGSTATQATP